MPGPLHGLKVVEMAGIGPGPFAAMMLADLGAEVIRILRPGQGDDLERRFDVMARGRRAFVLDLRQPESVRSVLELVAHADVLIEGYRPGVMERLGLGPEVCLQRNPRLVFGRLTGWGQDGPLANAPGHDINFIALAGALHAIGRSGEAPVIPLNYVGDFGGGGMLLAFGVMCAVHEARSSGKGQVVDAAMTDGAALLGSCFYGLAAAGKWNAMRGENFLDGGSHFYDTYACADGKYVSVGALEPQFYAKLCEICGIDDPLFDQQMDPRAWPMLKHRLADVFRTRTRDAWCALLEGSDACFAPVLDWDEAPRHPHNQARRTFIEVDQVVQPAPAPRFSRTPSSVPTVAPSPETDLTDILRSWRTEDPAPAARDAAGIATH
ncbi:Formyl-coenzyme A transferase [Variovorax sp. SRS16]|uniref:CaiB/BaiF CoA transferase family protein n=1 Tax=Variovorax sp. SRS16 TaxID=282217 RepID=UPI0013163625|nr:CaiB/BaiF CoA-transferase family protein [Variovorax sp. SRS16]VTU33589.1 Formyl-coenzyme A transferase [Variovorax sp. SRS16]